jgi:predicted dehydrogenase
MGLVIPPGCLQVEIPTKMQVSDGMNYAPVGKPSPVVARGEFKFGVVALDHGHIYGMTNGLLEAGADLKLVYDPDPAKIAAFTAKFPQVKVARSEDEVLEDSEIKLVAAAAIPCERGPLGCRVMKAGKDYFTDKTPFTSLAHLEEAKRVVKWSGKKYMVYYSERLHVECAMHAGTLIKQGAIGRVLNVMGLGPHRLNAKSRPAWFFERAKYGGILCDIGSHQIEQFLHFSGAEDATVTYARAVNHNNPDYPELEDFGEAMLLADNGATNYFRVDWFTPDGLRTWGDGRTIITGTDGYIELRKYIDVARPGGGNRLFLVNGKVEQEFDLNGKVGYPYFGQLILDCLYRTENAMTQAHAFKAAELCLKAQEMADRLRLKD